MSEIELTSDNFDKETSSGVVLVDFWASWCGPCKMIAPIIEEIAKEYEGKAKICKVNIEDYPDLASKFQVMSIPTLILLKDGAQQGQLMGAQAKDVIKQELDNLL